MCVRACVYVYVLYNVHVDITLCCVCVGVCVRCNQFPNVDISRIRHCDTILLTARFVMKTRARMGEGGGGGWRARVGMTVTFTVRQSYSSSVVGFRGWGGGLSHIRQLLPVVVAEGGGGGGGYVTDAIGSNIVIDYEKGHLVTIVWHNHPLIHMYM